MINNLILNNPNAVTVICTVLMIYAALKTFYYPKMIFCFPLIFIYGIYDNLLRGLILQAVICAAVAVAVLIYSIYYNMIETER